MSVLKETNNTVKKNGILRKIEVELGRPFFLITGKVVDVSNEVRKGLSTDQGYLLKACLTVQVGHDSSQYTLFLECNQPGNINHARWLMKASQVLCFYMSQKVTLKTLQRLLFS